jgi:hypothetical protein
MLLAQPLRRVRWGRARSGCFVVSLQPCGPSVACRGEGVNDGLILRASGLVEDIDVAQAGKPVAQLLYGSALALTAAIQAWSKATDTPVPDLTHEIVH